LTRVRSDRARLVLALIGLAIAGYLTLLHFDSNVPLLCAAGSRINCETVLTSSSAIVFGVPVAVWGVAWFGVTLVLAVLSIRAGPAGRAPLLRSVSLGWTLIGTGGVLWLLYQEMGVIGKICAWCTAVHVIVLSLVVVEAASDGAP